VIRPRSLIILVQTRRVPKPFGSFLAVGHASSVTTGCRVYSRRVKAEEKALLDTIGEPYRAYMARTKRIIPFIF
jgi:protein-S-isoprenylcysteine O-methyltransferase Ste14